MAGHNEETDTSDPRAVDEGIEKKCKDKHSDTKEAGAVVLLYRRGCLYSCARVPYISVSL